MASVSTTVRLLGPRLPLMLRTTMSHALSMSDTSSKWDLRSALVINVLRSIMCESTSSISRQQAFSLKDPGAKGEMWVSRTTLAAPEEDDVRQLLLRVIEEMNLTGHESYDEPDLLPVEGEWVGHRSGVGSNEPEPEMSEAEKYKSLIRETSSDATVLYFHGGAHYLMDPCTHRLPISKLAKTSGGRSFSVRYRLSPQHPFPAALLDALVAYLSLIYPPPGAFHEAVKPEHIILAGDSAGGNLALSLLLVLLHLHHQPDALALTFRGQKLTSIPLPGGAALTSPWCDVTRSMPSLHANFKYDYLPPSFAAALSDPAETSASSPRSKTPAGPPPCAIWPSPPPRTELYCQGSAMCHPLVSPLAAPAAAWKASPPVWISSGEETLADEIRVVARTLAHQEVRVRWQGYEAMPHCFAMLLTWLPLAASCMRDAGKWIKGVVESGPENATTGAVWTAARSGMETALEFDDLTRLTVDDVAERMTRERERRTRLWEDEVQQLQGKSECAKL